MLRLLVVTAACLVSMLSIAEGAQAATCVGEIPSPNPARGSSGTLFIVCDDEVSDVTAGTATPNKVTLSGKDEDAVGWSYDYQLTDSSYEGDIDIAFTATGGTPFTAQILDVGFPGCSDDSEPVRAGTTGDGAVGIECEDPDTGDTLTASITTPPTAGTIGAFTGGGPGQIIRFFQADYQVPAGTPPGDRTFEYSVNDGHGGVDDNGTGTLTVGDAAPSCTSRTVNVARNTSVGIPLSCSDPNAGTTLHFDEPDDEDPPLVELGTLGTFNFSGTNPITGSVTFTAGSETGPDSFAYNARDDYGRGQPGIVNINVTGSGGPGSPGSPGGPGGGTPAGSRLTTKGKQKGSSGAVTGSFTNAIAGSSAAISVTGNSKGGTLAKAVVLGKRKLKNLKAGKVKFKVKLTKKAKKQLKRALRRKKAVKVKLKIVITPPSGSGFKAAPLRKSIKLVR